MNALTLWWYLQRRGGMTWSAVCSVIAFAAATAVLLITLGGLGAFTARGEETYVILAQIASVIVVVPVINLGIAAARLSVSRRNQTLARLRLAGASNGQVTILTMADAVSQALVGAVGGALLYLPLIPIVGAIPFQGRAFGAELWVGVGPVLAAVAGVTVVASVAALTSVLAVAVGPLGVSQRITPRSLGWLRAVLAVLVMGAWLVAFRPDADKTMLLVMLALCFVTLAVVGPFVLNVVGRVAARLARTPAQLLAARRLTDDPRGAWRAVGTVAMATFVAAVASAFPVLDDGTAQGSTRHLSTDLPTGALLVLAFTALLAAVSVGVTQTTQTLDRADALRALHLAGTDVSVLQRARSLETWLPLAWAVGTGAAMGLVLLVPIARFLLRQPQGLVLFVGTAAGAMALVMAAVWLTQPLVRRLVSVTA